ncbi:2-oxoglutarate dehydrogenase E2 component (dihydrolipoamide succinyltransferase) [Nonomuraea solani]|uniref:Dihydrolipoamide acetyltransferase component of pyruvate dehydrogenase complex n=1 Tax=Nonomuraea solani TaxID=1144553 RepID=A0A1H6F155_9ACTN|nr:2-oxo acid dehydrogenase subunit E2 [Nonomuraea solani]SEH02916.1 2-oxoglutarate dehydrogenase E2 component (dihydrolipoamide succinyltransferase) [Nonomuraea solani]
MGEIRVPKLNNNDSEYTLLEWLAEDGAPVRRDDPVATLETSKTVEELVSEQDGALTQLVRTGMRCVPGQLIARVGPMSAADPAPGPEPVPAAGGPLVTAPARALLDELGLDPALVAGLDVKVVRRTDVERLAAEMATGGGRTRTLSGHQRAVGRTVTLSHQAIPAGYTVIKVDVTPALATARTLTRRLRRLVGLPDLLVAAVARLHDDFPMFFAELIDDQTVRIPDQPRVGVTIDMGSGLYVPVIRDRLAVPDIAERLAEFRRLAQHGGFGEEHLTGGNIVVTLHHDADIILAIPIIFPGQTCAVALTSPQPEGERTVAAIGLAYDHRIVNGREVVLFLQALKETLERPSEGL